MAAFNSILDLIGNTPLVRINKLNQSKAEVWVKVESFNPLGSAKDRVALRMIEKAEEEGKLKPGALIIEPTSGNTGVGLAYVGAVKGYKVALTMPDSMSLERRMLLKSLGAQVVLTEGDKGMAGCIEKAEEMARENPGSFIPGQFENPSNPEAHYLTTGPEIWKDTDGKIDIFVATAGTGGTVSGTARFLKEKNPAIKVVAIEPEASPMITKGVAGPHKIQGIGANFIPKNYDASLVDEVYLTTPEAAGKAARDAAQQEGLFVGISSGAALEAALTIAKRPENAGKKIVALLPDTGERYLSTWLWSE
ncbi:MAG: cysteine synthase A [Fibrobacteraceae bacterium]|mgnify:CR=1 FL=1|nr:cysteine synthase A [Fibrobacteraceae bacterium]